MSPRHHRLAPSPLLTTLAVAAVAEMVWTVYVGYRLPRHYVANHWDLAWVGMDAAQIILLIGCAWAAWRRRAVLVLFTSSTATLLVLDAWFDVTTARHGGLRESLLSAALLEIPSAVVLLWITQRTLRQIARNTYGEALVRRITIPESHQE